MCDPTSIVTEHIRRTKQSLLQYKKKCPDFFYPADEFFARCVMIFGRSNLNLLCIMFDAPKDVLLKALQDIVRDVYADPNWSSYAMSLSCLLTEIRASIPSYPKIPTRQNNAVLTVKQREKGAPMHHGTIAKAITLA